MTTGTTTNASEAELRAEILRLGPWHHDFEIAPGIRTGAPVPAGTYPPELGTPTVIQPEQMAKVLELIYPDGMNGRSMLDCACNAGGYLYAAARYGLSRGFGFDVREHWIEQARFLARYLPSENLQFEVRALESLPELGLEPFDLTLFSGILYHLPDPVAGLRIAADLTRELIIVNTDIEPQPFEGLVLSMESDTLLMSGVDRLAWHPTGAAVLRKMLAWCGFPHTRLLLDRATRPGFRRVAIMGARDERTFVHFDKGCAEAAAYRPSRVARLMRLLR